MIPKLALNFSIDKDIKPDELKALFGRMRACKIIYVQAVVKGITKIDELRPIIILFKWLRSSKYIDYTLWIEAGINFEQTVLDEAKKLDKYVMGLSDDIKLDSVDIYTLMQLDDHAALAHSQKNIDLIAAPAGMKNGLKRVVDDCAKIFSLSGESGSSLRVEQSPSVPESGNSSSHQSESHQ